MLALLFQAKQAASMIAVNDRRDGWDAVVDNLVVDANSQPPSPRSLARTRVAVQQPLPLFTTSNSIRGGGGLY